MATALAPARLASPAADRRLLVPRRPRYRRSRRSRTLSGRWEGDGATYHRSATARDRDKLREQVLRGLGWDMLSRVWSTDWWIDPAGTLGGLDTRLRAVLAAQRERRAEQAEREAEAERLAQAAIAQAMASVTKPDEETASPIQDADPIAQEVPATTRSEQVEEVFARQVSAAPAHADAEETSPAEALLYRVADPTEAVAGANPDRFFDGEYNGVLSAMIAHVVDHEGPVLDALLARRIARAHGWLRTGGRIRERVFQIARARYRTTDEEVGTFYWPEHIDPTTEPPFPGPPTRTACGRSTRSVFRNWLLWPVP